MDVLEQLKLAIENGEINNEADDLGELDDLDDLDLSEEEETILQVLTDNGLDDGNEEYRIYSPDNKGCSKEHPFIINESVGFISLEKELIQYIMTECPNRNVKYKFIRQSYTLLGEQHLDKLTYRVTEPTTKNTHIEDYWFDITAGMLNAARKDGIKC